MFRKHLCKANRTSYGKLQLPAKGWLTGGFTFSDGKKQAIAIYIIESISVYALDTPESNISDKSFDE